MKQNDSFDKIVSEEDSQSATGNLATPRDYGKDSFGEPKLHAIDLEATLSKAISQITAACEKIGIVRAAIGDYILK